MSKSKTTRQPSAAHRALLNPNLPFKNRAEELKTRYQRRLKHQSRAYEL